MSADQPTEMMWTRHTTRVTGTSPILGTLLLVVAGSLGTWAAIDGAWGFVAFALLLCALSPVLVVPSVLRLSVEKDSVLVLRQPLLRNVALYLGVGTVGAGLVLAVGYHDSGVVWPVLGATIAVLGVLASAWAFSAASFRVTSSSLDFVDGSTFPIDTVEATVTWNYRSDDTLTVSARQSGKGKRRRVIALRSQAVHPNTMLSTIEQLREWRGEHVFVPPETVAAMLAIPDQPDVRATHTVCLPLNGQVSSSDGR